jgi:adenylate cyclase class IV
VGSLELELKGVVPDPAALAARLTAAGGRRAFRGMLHDRRFDRAGELAARDEVLRTRRWVPDEGTPRTELGWKGPTARSPEGYKSREERELTVTGGDAEALLAGLGYAPVHAIDRRVEVWHVAEAVVRVEWYPRMDVLVEVEGAPGAIEAAIRASGLARESFSDEPLAAFTARYDAAHPGAPSLVAREGWLGGPA